MLKWVPSRALVGAVFACLAARAPFGDGIRTRGLSLVRRRCGKSDRSSGALSRLPELACVRENIGRSKIVYCLNRRGRVAILNSRGRALLTTAPEVNSHRQRTGIGTTLAILERQIEQIKE